MTTIAGTQIVPVEPAFLPALLAADRGVASALESVLSDNTQRVYGAQWRILTGWCDEVWLTSLPRRAPHRGPLPGRPGQCRRQHRYHPPGHQRHLESPRMGEAGIARPGPGRARLSEGMGKTAGKTPAPVRRTPRRRAGRDPPHRRPAPQARPRLRDDRAGVSKGQVRRGPGRRAVGWRIASQRGDIADLGRRAALGRRQRPHHRDPLQDRRGSPGRRGGHHRRRHGSALRHPAGGRGRRWGKCSGCRNLKSPGG